MDNKDFEMLYNSKIDKHIEYLKDCWLNKKTITIEDAKYFIKEFTHREGIDPGVDIGLVFKEFNLNIKKEFKAGDKVKLNQPMHHSMEKQVPYKKYYDVVVTDTMDYGDNELQILGIDGIKGMVSSEFFDLYTEYDNKEKIEDEFNVGDFVILKENDNKPGELEFNNLYKVESVKQTGFKFIKIKGKKYYWRTSLFNKVNLGNIKFENNLKSPEFLKYLEPAFEEGKIAEHEFEFGK